MDNIISAFEFLVTRLLPLLTAFAAGILVGIIYIRKCIANNKAVLYHSSVIMASFFISLATIRFVENGAEGFGHWLFIFIMYIFYTVGMIIGKRF